MSTIYLLEAKSINKKVQEELESQFFKKPLVIFFESDAMIPVDLHIALSKHSWPCQFVQAETMNQMLFEMGKIAATTGHSSDEVEFLAIAGTEAKAAVKALTAFAKPAPRATRTRTTKKTPSDTPEKNAPVKRTKKSEPFKLTISKSASESTESKSKDKKPPISPWLDGTSRKFFQTMSKLPESFPNRDEVLDEIAIIMAEEPDANAALRRIKKEHGLAAAKFIAVNINLLLSAIKDGHMKKVDEVITVIR